MFNIKFNLLSLCQRLIAFTAYCFKVNEDIIPVDTLDETRTFFSSSHLTRPAVAISIPL